MRQRPFGIAGERHGLALLVLAPQRGDRCMGKRFCMGLPLISVRHPTPGIDGADNGLAAGVDVDVLDGDFLLSLAAMAVQRFEGRCHGNVVGCAR